MVRDKIKTYFRNELKINQPKFFQQGSFSLLTMINPLDGEVDLDDGVYLQNLDDDQSNWPKTETVHSWVYKAVENHTNEKPQDKKNCIRVRYAGNYHLDLPIYGFCNGNYLLARKGNEQWIESDPKKFKDWFMNIVKENGEQLRRNIRYLKAWNDFNSHKITGMILTILVGNHFGADTDRDDKSLINTVSTIINNLKLFRAVYNPVDLNENLLSGWDSSEIDSMISNFEFLLKDGLDALGKENKEEASKIWIKLFGDRFPYYENKKIDSNKSIFLFNSNNSNRINITNPPKPWGDR